MVIFRPICQVGWRSAASGPTASRSRGGRSRKGPPEAVRMRRRTSCAARPCRHWWMALCSLSTGRMDTPRRRAADVTSSPAMTSTSLLARATRFPDSMAAITASSPAVPDDAHNTMSASGWVATPTRPSAAGEHGAGERRTAARNRSAASAVARATTAGRYRCACSASRSALSPAASPTTCRRSGCASTTDSALRPIEPVDPRIARRFRCRLACKDRTPESRTAARRPGPARRRGRESDASCPSSRRCA